MKVMVADIYFYDEVPRVGSGWRRCDVLIGRKWAYVIERATGKRNRMLRAAFERIDARELHGLAPRRNHHQRARAAADADVD